MVNFSLSMALSRFVISAKSFFAVTSTAFIAVRLALTITLWSAPIGIETDLVRPTAEVRGRLVVRLTAPFLLAATGRTRLTALARVVAALAAVRPAVFFAFGAVPAFLAEGAVARLTAGGLAFADAPVRLAAGFAADGADGAELAEASVAAATFGLLAFGAVAFFLVADFLIFCLPDQTLPIAIEQWSWLRFRIASSTI